MLTTDLTSAIAGTIITATASVKNPENAALTDIPAIELSYKVGEGAETSFTGSFVIPEGTATGTTITVYARTAESQNYEAAEKTVVVTVIDCPHANKSDKWTTDGTYHWHICSDCGEPADKTAHSGGTATCISKAACTECGESYGEIDSANHVNVSQTWSKGDTGHWHACANCTEKVDFAAHTSSGAATPDTAETCTICGYEINPKTGGSGSGSGSGSSGGSSSSSGTAFPSIDGVKMSWTALNNSLKTLADGAEITDASAITDMKLGLTIESKLSTDGIRGVEGLKFTTEKLAVPADLTLILTKKYVGQFANVYKLVDGKLEFVICQKIAEDGTVTLENIEGGTYAVTICEYSDLKGDMNNDGKLTAADATATLKYVVNLISDGNILMADLDGDGKINARDALITLRKVVGLE